MTSDRQLNKHTKATITKPTPHTRTPTIQNQPMVTTERARNNNTGGLLATGGGPEQRAVVHQVALEGGGLVRRRAHQLLVEPPQIHALNPWRLPDANNETNTCTHPWWSITALTRFPGALTDPLPWGYH